MSSENFHLSFYLMDDKLRLALVRTKFPAQVPPDLVPVFFPVPEKCSIGKYNVGKLFFFLSADIFSVLHHFGFLLMSTVIVYPLLVLLFFLSKTLQALPKERSTQSADKFM